MGLRKERWVQDVDCGAIHNASVPSSNLCNEYECDRWLVHPSFSALPGKPAQAPGVATLAGVWFEV
jgi:hypothetical protein